MNNGKRKQFVLETIVLLKNLVSLFLKIFAPKPSRSEGCFLDASLFLPVARRLMTDCSVGEGHNGQLHHTTPIHYNQLAFLDRKPGLV